MLRMIVMELNKAEEKRQDLKMRLENLIVDKPISVKRLAFAIGMHDMTLAAFLRGRRETSPITLARIENYLLREERDKE